jgi:hypothetical protein
VSLLEADELRAVEASDWLLAGVAFFGETFAEAARTERLVLVEK